MKFNFYKDKAGEWRWNITARNGRIVAEGGEGYKNPNDMMKTIDKYIVGASGMSDKMFRAANNANLKFDSRGRFIEVAK